MSDSGDFDRSAVSFKAEENNDNSSSDEEDAAQDQKKPRFVATAARILRKKPSNAKRKDQCPDRPIHKVKGDAKNSHQGCHKKVKKLCTVSGVGIRIGEKCSTRELFHHLLENSGPQFRRATLSEKPLEYFKLFFTDAVWQLFVSKTNQNAIFKKVKKWKETNLPEMQAFFGLVLAMGILRLPKMRDY